MDNEEVRKLLVDADSAMSLIYYRAGSLIASRFGDEFKKELYALHRRCREMSERLKVVPPTPEASICRWCAEGRPEWSCDAKAWIHRRDRLDRRCQNPPAAITYTLTEEEDQKV